MTTTYLDAQDEMFGMINDAWQNQVAPLVGYTPELRWPYVPEPTTPDNTKHWGRVSRQTVTDSASGFGGDGTKRYTATGLLFVQLFGPTGDDGAVQIGYQIASLLKNIFHHQSPSGKVWFRNARIQELPPNAGAYRFNVVAEYEYDEMA